jgi:sirohydrochlorin cobaltochelatase
MVSVERRAVAICAHGAEGLAGAVTAHAEALAETGEFVAVRGCALFGKPKLETVLSALAEEAETIGLLPFLMAEGYTYRVLAERLRAHPAADSVRLGRAFGRAPQLPELMLRKALGACGEQGWQAAETALLLVAHGTPSNPASAEATRALASALAQTGRFAELACAFLDQAPSFGEAAAALHAPRCLVLGCFTDAGGHGGAELAGMVAALERPAAYAGPIGPDPAVAGILLSQARALFEAGPRDGEEGRLGHAAL